MKDEKRPPTENSWMNYLGLGMQFFVSILLALVVGWKADAYFGFEGSLLIWILPLLAVLFNLIKIVLDTQKKKQ